MQIICPENPRNTSARSGFALIVVLAGLAILAALFAVTTSTAISHAVNQRADLALLNGQSDRLDLLDRVLSSEPEQAASLEGIHLIDVGGYIDLNTGDPQLIKLVIDALGLSSSAHQKYVDWRRTPRRFTRLEDFLRVTGARQNQLPMLQSLATVHSGRRGIDPETAPLVVLKLLTGGAGTRTSLISRLPPALISEPSGVNFRVWIAKGDGERYSVGVVHLAQSPEQRRILWVD